MGRWKQAAQRVRKRAARTDRHMESAGRSVLITGGSRGLGLELAREFGRREARVAICGRDADELARAEADLRARGVDIVTFVADVRDRSEVERAVAAATERFGVLDILVNNAGVIEVGPLEAITMADYEDAMATHFWGPLFSIEAVMPAMRARRSGRIVNIASIGGRISVPHLLPYSASKFALVGLSEGLRAELIRDRVYVTTVLPGLMRTGSPENATFKGRNTLEYAWFSIGDSLPFVSIDVTEAARAIVDAAERGDAELTLTLPAALLSIAKGVFPSAVVEVLGVVARLLPTFGGIGTRSRRGKQSHSALSPSPLTIATQRAAVSQNEVGL
jgi:NAD(P)-dependent dehydrogenase (short-subunit alcohol dehydrogenase family)